MEAADEMRSITESHVGRDLTPREYLTFKAAFTDPKAAATYRLAIVRGALDQRPDLAIFRHLKGAWRRELTDRVLGFL